MLFNSYVFIFGFLPVALIGFALAAHWGGRVAAQSWLIAASLFFYGWWNIAFLLPLGVLMLFNYGVGQALLARPSKALLAFGVGTDLAALGYYKYAGFLVTSADAVLGLHWSIGAIALPLAISFFTFQKIAYLVDSQRGLTRGFGFREYALFVTFFPQLIAGPIVHYRDVLPQFREEETYRIRADNLAIGSTIFVIGLAKKVLLADNIAPYADSLFASAAGGSHPDLIAAWSGALAYTLQLYFDFSGYTDMAIGGARLFGIVLPLNFASPYKAANIVEFWHRWHMTLSRFLREYLYIGLGGNRKGPARRYLNLMLTMLLGGLWHGAAWTYVAWGGLHGGYLCINHGWRKLRPGHWAEPGRTERGLGWAITFVAVVAAWVLFRATSFAAALRVLGGMAGLHGVALPDAVVARLPVDSATLASLGIATSGAGGAAFLAAWGWIVPLLGIALFAPNTQQLLARYRPALDAAEPTPAAPVLHWRPSPGWALATGALAGLAVLGLAQVSTFLYFQF